MMSPVPPQEAPTDCLTTTIIGFVEPFFRAGSGAAASTTAAIAALIDAYAPATPAERDLVGRMLAYSAAAMDSLRLSMQPGLADTKVLRYRSGAVALGRSSEQCRKILEAMQAKRERPPGATGLGTAALAAVLAPLAPRHSLSPASTASAGPSSPAAPAAPASPAWLAASQAPVTPPPSTTPAASTRSPPAQASATPVRSPPPATPAASAGPPPGTRALPARSPTPAVPAALAASAAPGGMQLRPDPPPCAVLDRPAASGAAAARLSVPPGPAEQGPDAPTTEARSAVTPQRQDAAAVKPATTRHCDARASTTAPSMLEARDPASTDPTELSSTVGTRSGVTPQSRPVTQSEVRIGAQPPIWEDAERPADSPPRDRATAPSGPPIGPPPGPPPGPSPAGPPPETAPGPGTAPPTRQAASAAARTGNGVCPPAAPPPSADAGSANSPTVHRPGRHNAADLPHPLQPPAAVAPPATDDLALALATPEFAIDMEAMRRSARAMLADLRQRARALCPDALELPDKLEMPAWGQSARPAPLASADRR